MAMTPVSKPFTGPTGGWGSAGGVAQALLEEGVPLSGSVLLAQQNKRLGFACVSCAWPKPVKPRVFEFCENGAKATAWEVTSARARPEFFRAHSVSELLGWSDYALEKSGRLTDPLRWDAASDRYLPVAWDAAFAEIGAELRRMNADEAVFYASGRASLETSYMYALMARMYGTNNLPDSSNMCHESTSVALPQSIGVPVGTVRLEDFAEADCFLFFGQNVGSNSPRMLHDLQDAAKRGVPIINFNPLRERGLERFTNPQSPVEMLSGYSTRISSQVHQVRPGGDLAAMTGIAMALFAGEAAGEVRLDHGFIAEHTHGFEAFKAAMLARDWTEIEAESGLTRQALEAAATVYGRSERVIGVYGMGLTQHRAGVETVQMLANLLLLRGNVGRTGAGICPVRGHSNVQGQRTVGITEKPELVPNERLRAQFGFEPPMRKGLNTVEACEQILAGRIKGFVMLGGNFVRAIPEREAMETAWRRMRLTVSVATKLNRSHLVHGAVSFILPCLGRIERDVQAGGVQAVSVEDSTACIHGSKGMRAPASRNLLSEPAIVAGIAKATLAANPLVPWDAWVADYSLVRDAIAASYPDSFFNFNARLWTAGGFPRPIAARERVWQTATGKANFIVTENLTENEDMPAAGPDVLRMMTLRSNGQFNTTIYSLDDRLRGISGTRMVVLMHQADITRLGFHEGMLVEIATVSGDGVDRRMAGFRVTRYDIPPGCIGTYYPEANALIPLWHHAKESKVPAAKSIPVRLTAPAQAMATE